MSGVYWGGEWKGRVAMEADLEYVELLIYNCGHLDLLLGLSSSSSLEKTIKCESTSFPLKPGENSSEGGIHDAGEKFRLRNAFAARPKFNSFHPVCKEIVRIIKGHAHAFPSLSSPLQKEDGDSTTVPIGLDLNGQELPMFSWKDFRVKEDSKTSSIINASGEASSGIKASGEASSSINSSSAASSSIAPLRVEAVLIPLVSQVVSSWLEIVEDKLAQRNIDCHKCKKVIVFVSGSGIPGDKRVDSELNSTVELANFAAKFSTLHWPDVCTMVLDSRSGIFSYDQNVRFCCNVLLPNIDSLRQALVCKFPDDWRSRLRATVALTDGSSARQTALNAALRRYKPDYIHMSQLKTYWYKLELSESDILHYPFKTIEMNPAISYDDLNADCKKLVDEVRAMVSRFQRAHAENALNELHGFWLRKSGKCVLSVLMVKSSDEPNERKFFQGVNLEVSMPTGSLCAERNVIGCALASDPTLKRKDICMIAVISLDFTDRSGSNAALLPADIKSKIPEKKRRRRSRSLDMVRSDGLVGGLNPIQPCGACKEWLKKIAEVNPRFKVMTFVNLKCDMVFLREYFAE